MSAACLGKGGAAGMPRVVLGLPQAQSRRLWLWKENELKAFIAVSSGQCFIGCRPGVSADRPRFLASVLGCTGLSGGLGHRLHGGDAPVLKKGNLTGDSPVPEAVHEGSGMRGSPRGVPGQPCSGGGRVHRKSVLQAAGPQTRQHVGLVLPRCPGGPDGIGSKGGMGEVG